MSSHTNGVNLTGLNNLETNVAVVLIVRRTRKSGTDTSVDVRVVPQKTLHGSMVEIGTVVDRSNLARRTTEDLGLPGVAASLVSPRKALVWPTKKSLTDGCRSE